MFLFGRASEKAHVRYRVEMWWRGVDLTWSTLESLNLSAERSCMYTDSGGPDLRVVMDTLPISGEDAALDLGCGKGGALFTMAEYPFRTVDGVDISEELVDIARENLKRLKITNASLYCMDASEFKDLDIYTVFYMFNPFPDAVVQSVLENILRSVERCPRKITMIYKNPVLENLLLDAGFQPTAKLTHSIHPFCLYTMGPGVGVRAGAIRTGVTKAGVPNG
jgi:SAM-dependent methyltransferase